MPNAENDAAALTLPAASRIGQGMNTNTPRMVVTDCCGQLLPESQTLVGDVHFSDLCPACDWLADREGEQPEHDRHITCDWSQGIECPGRDWSYVDGQVVAAPLKEGGHDNSRVIPPEGDKNT